VKSRSIRPRLGELKDHRNVISGEGEFCNRAQREKVLGKAVKKSKGAGKAGARIRTEP